MAKTPTKVLTADGKRETLNPIHPNAGIQSAYQKRLDKLISDMDASLSYWLGARYRAETPEIAMDASPAAELNRAFRKLARRWQRKFDQLAPTLATMFADEAAAYTDKAFSAALRDAGFTVRFKPTRAQNDVYRATIAENVSLIKSVGSQHLTQVEGVLMRSVSGGRSLGEFASALEETYGVTKRRAALISLDQNNKATATMTRVRQKELGITKAKWVHSAGGKEPRPSHVANNGKLYDVEKGWYDPDEGKWIRPGELIRCRCVSVSVIPGFEP